MRLQHTNTSDFPSGFGIHNHVSASMYGVEFCDPADYTPGAPTGTASKVAVSGWPDDHTYALQIEYNAGADSFIQIDLGAGTTVPAHMDTYGVWINNPTSHWLAFTFSLFQSVGGVNKPVCRGAARPGIHFYTFNYWDLQSRETTTDKLIRYVRPIVYNTSTFFTWTTGDYLQFGKSYYGFRTRPKFIFWTDDFANSGGIFNDLAAYGGGPVSGAKNMPDMLAYYGFAGSANVPTGGTVATGGYDPASHTWVGETGHLTWANAATLKSRGWSICNHSTTIGWTSYGGGNGITALSYDDMVAELSAAKSILDAKGYSGHIYALPQGATSPRVIAAAEAAGIKMIIGTSKATNAAGSFTPYGYYPALGRSASNKQGLIYNEDGTTSAGGTNGGFDDLTGRIQLDSPTAYTEAEVKSYVDECIKYGITGGVFTHGLTTSAAMDLLDNVCDYVKTKQDQGLIDVITADEWYEGMRHTL